MAKTWSADDPKAALMARKRALIVNAAQKAFLESGYAEASVNHIAEEAGVSIKTLYRHFESKDDLFNAVMQGACGNGANDDAEANKEPPAWYAAAPAKAFPLAGEAYLRHILSPDQLALYRVVVRDSDRFPELGHRYLEVAAGGRDRVFADYLDLWREREGWKVRDNRAAAQIYASLLKSSIFDDVLLGLPVPSAKEIRLQARSAAENMLTLLRAGRF